MRFGKYRKNLIAAVFIVIICVIALQYITLKQRNKYSGTEYIKENPNTCWIDSSQSIALVSDSESNIFLCTKNSNVWESDIVNFHNQKYIRTEQRKLDGRVYYYDDIVLLRLSKETFKQLRSDNLKLSREITMSQYSLEKYPDLCDSIGNFDKLAIH